MNKEGKIPTISVKEVVSTALSDPRSTEATKWIKDTRELVIKKGTYPSRRALHANALDESSYLVLAGFVSTIPGGGASPITHEIVLNQLSSIGTENLHDRSMRVILLTHGSAVFCGTRGDGTHATGIPAESDGVSIPAGINYHLDTLHAETSCGVTGRSSRTRDRLHQNIDLLGILLEAKKQQLGLPSIVVEPIEALVGQRDRRYPINSPFAFRIHDAREVTFHQNPPRDLDGSIAYPDLRNDGLSATDLNDRLRQIMDKGELIIGVGCLDIRQGIGLENPAVKPLDLNQLAADIQREYSTFRKLLTGENNPNTSWQLLGHSELPIGVILNGKDQKTLQLAYWLQTHAGAILRGSTLSGLLAPARPAIISVPEGTLTQPERETLIKQLTGLISNLDRQVFRRWGTAGYIMIEDIVSRIARTNGLQLGLPEGPEGRQVLQNLQPGIPMILNNMSNQANPPFRLFRPGSRRSIGFIVSDLPK